MTVFRLMNKLFWKNKFALLIYLALFILSSVIASRLVKNTPNISGDFKNINARILIKDLSDSEGSRDILEYITKEQKTEYLESSDQRVIAKEKLMQTEADVYIEIYPGFERLVEEGKKTIWIEGSANNPDKMTYVLNRAYEYLQLKSMLAPGVSQEYFRTLLDTEADTKIVSFSKENQNKTSNISLYYFFKYSSYFTIGGVVQLVGISLVSLRDTKIKIRNKLSVISSTSQSLQMFLGMLVLASSLIIVVISVAVIIYSGVMSHLAVHALNYSAFVSSIVALAFMLSELLKTKMAISAVSNTLALGSSFISGIFVPAEFLPDYVISIAKFFPTYHFAEGAKLIMENGAVPSPQIAVQLLYTLCFLVLGVVIAKKEMGAEAAIEI